MQEKSLQKTNYFRNTFNMSVKKTVTESELATLAKQFREKAGRTKMEAARELGVGRPSVQLAEENPEQSLTSLRIRLIEKYSPYRVVGPLYRLEKK
jgi:DNA-binding XRE family transcriptional regulator